MRRARYVAPLLFVWALLGASECTENSINRDINETFGFNTDSPVQVGLAIALGNAIGNPEQQDMGGALKDFRRADHQQKVERFYNKGDNDSAIIEFNTALRWTGTGAQQDRARADIEMSLALAHASRGDGGREQYDGRQAAKHYGNAIGLREQDPAYKADPKPITSKYISQGWSLLSAGDYGASCNSARTAGKRGGDVATLLDALQKHGLTCKV